MPSRDRAEYMKDYRAARKANQTPLPVVKDPGRRINGPEDIVAGEWISEEVVPPAKRTTVMENGEILSAPAGFACGCRPDDLCISHGIAKMPQVARDKVLASPEINRPGRKGGKE